MKSAANLAANRDIIMTRVALSNDRSRAKQYQLTGYCGFDRRALDHGISKQ